MNILIISLDKGLLGQGQLGDVCERHKEYGKRVDSIDIIVFSKSGYSPYVISENVSAFPTNSSYKFLYIRDAMKIARRLFEKKHYDLIITQDPFITATVGIRLKKMHTTKLLIHFHGDFLDNGSFLREDWKNRYLVLLAKHNMKEADAFRAMSIGIQKKLILNGVPENKIKVIPTPVDISKFGNTDINKVEAIRKDYENKKIILFVGRLEKVKDIETLIHAYEEVAKKINNATLVVIGSGSEGAKLKDLCAGKKLDVHFLEQKEQKDIIAYYYACDIFVLSSLSESFGKVLIEASACGKPVISTATTGAMEIIKDGYNGFLVGIGDYSLMGEKILYILKNFDVALAMGQNAKKYVFENFDGKVVTEKIIAFWNNIVHVIESASFLRQEIKFLIPWDQLNTIIGEMRKFMEFDEYSNITGGNFYKIINVYFDTQDFQCYHQRKDITKELTKYRLRIYVEPDTEDFIVYPEIKKRKGKYVKKFRVKISYSDFSRIMQNMSLDKASNMPAESREIIQEFLQIASQHQMKPILFVNYKRCAMVGGLNKDIRVIFDKEFTAGSFQGIHKVSDGNILLENASIMEVKYSDELPQWLKEIILKYQIREFHDSKYCIAVQRCFNLH
ncbi:MAG: Glycosyltransferase [Parcubacteria group bacterium GW2011_GWA2_38_13]|nr:MAG: Glycosyltransferase [Parcubacteria group bacterium GW2011_GWA2_38_13]